MAADVNAILLAREGLQERDHALFTAIYGAAGIKLPPLHEEQPIPETLKAGVRAWARQHNARFAAERTAAQVRERAVARARATAETKSD